MRGPLSLSLAGLLVAACVSVSGPGATVPPINIPTLPPVNNPSIAIPSIAIPSIAIPSIDIPTLPPLPSIPAVSIVPGADMCALVTAAELQAMFGGPATVVTGSSGECTITPPDSIFPIVMRNGLNESIAAAKMITENGEDLTIGGFPAFYGELMGGILYVEKAGRTLVLQAPLSTEAKDDLIRVAEVAIARF